MAANMIKNMKKKDPEAFMSLVQRLFNEELECADMNIKSEPQYSRKVSRKDTACSLTGSHLDALYHVIEFLGMGKNVTEEGIFRKSGRLKKQHELLEMMDKEEEIDFHTGEFTIHECASVLKTFLGKLPEPLATERCYSAHLAVALLSENCKSQEEKAAAIEKQVFCTQLLFEVIPEESLRLLKDLLFLLHGVSQREEENKMSSTNLGTMFSTHIFCPKLIPPEELQAKSGLLAKAATFLIENPTLIFTVPGKLLAEVKSFQLRRNSAGRVSLIKKTSQGGLGVAGLIAGAAFSFNNEGELFVAKQKCANNGNNENNPEEVNGKKECMSRLGDNQVLYLHIKKEDAKHSNDEIESSHVSEKLSCTVTSQLNLNLNILDIKK